MSRKFLILCLLASLILAVCGVLYALTPKTGPNLTLEAFGGPETLGATPGLKTPQNARPGLF